MSGNKFRVGITRDFLKEDETLGFGDIGLDLLREDPRIEFEFLAERRPELLAAEIQDYDALLVL
ncbi:MAG: dehydrogenase, partial [Planctomycetota bacterium]